MPTSGAGRQIGSGAEPVEDALLDVGVERRRPVYMVIITTLVTMMPGSRNCRYSPVDPASAPPNR